MAVSLQSLGLVVLAAVLLQTVAVAFSFLYFSRALGAMQENFSQSSVSCLINIQLQPGMQLDPPAEDEAGDPCWQVTQQLHHLIEKKIASIFQGDVSPPAVSDKLTAVLPTLHPGTPVFPPSKVAAHVTGVASSVRAPADDPPWNKMGYIGDLLRAWEGQRGLSFLQNMELRGGELLVPRAGLYYIYAQTYFRLPSTGDSEGETREEGAELIQYIYKKMSSYMGPILLMKSSRSACWPRGQEPGLFSLHQAGTAFLQPADRLFITVSNASAVEMDGRASYFGAFLVG